MQSDINSETRTLWQYFHKPCNPSRHGDKDVKWG